MEVTTSLSTHARLSEPHRPVAESSAFGSFDLRTGLPPTIDAQIDPSKQTVLRNHAKRFALAKILVNNP